ncbi:hypothetical protein KAR91_64470 [Candidatus Pacearchaeota archaeon]|nr:hypothetical protein [Candidatus Pacearchaeota archaeon]
MFKKISLVLMLMVFMASSGCGLNTLPAPESTSEKIAYAEATLTGITLTVTDLNDQRLISLNDTLSMEKMITNAEDLLDLAKAAMFAADEAKAKGNLIAALTLLTELNRIITERGQS